MSIQIRVDDSVSPALQRLANTQLPQIRKDFVQRLSRSALEKIVNDTPVKTGRAKAAWANGLSQLGGQGILSGASADAIAEGHSQGTASLSETPDHTEVLATNEVNYITFLEYGTRRMAPRAIVRKALSALRSLAASFLTLSSSRSTSSTR